MKANVPKAWQNLPSAQRKNIRDYAIKIAQEQSEKDGRIILDLYIKMVCLTLHDAFGFGEKRLMMFLGNHKRLFMRQQKLVKQGEQLKYLDERLAKIFRKDGFPQGFFDGMLGEVNIEED